MKKNLQIQHFLPIYCDFQTKSTILYIKTVFFTNILGILLQFLAVREGVTDGFA
jgi:hypothetical protein